MCEWQQDIGCDRRFYRTQGQTSHSGGGYAVAAVLATSAEIARARIMMNLRIVLSPLGFRLNRTRAAYCPESAKR